MRVILQVTSGPSQGRQIPLQSGEVARFGRSDVADVCFPEDTHMSDVHFELECRNDHCVVRHVGASGGTLINEQVVTQEVACADGDVIVAGQTQLTTSIQGLRQDDLAEDASTETSEEAEPKLTATELCSLIELEEASLQLFRPSHTPDEFIRVLTENKQFIDAVQLLARYLPKRDAVFWAHQSVSNVFPRELTGDERESLDAVMTWLKSPSDENRRAAMGIAEAVEFGTPASWVAVSAFWSGGSLAPVGLPDALPDEHLCGQGVASCLLMTAHEGEPSGTEDRYQQMMTTGMQLLSGAIQSPEIES